MSHRKRRRSRVVFQSTGKTSESITRAPLTISSATMSCWHCTSAPPRANGKETDAGAATESRPYSYSPLSRTPGRRSQLSAVLSALATRASRALSRESCPCRDKSSDSLAVARAETLPFRSRSTFDHQRVELCVLHFLNPVMFEQTLELRVELLIVFNAFKVVTLHHPLDVKGRYRYREWIVGQY